ncbi:MAG: hypothetical protein RLZZ630_1568 [Bacteroidota bacterium]|jgi:hypothetical protein
MEKILSDNWLTEKHIDFEYKKYVLLAWLQHVSDRFEETRLYPALSELVKHYRNLVSLRDQKKQLYGAFPEKLSQADLQQFKLVYDKLTGDDQLMQELEQIIQFSIPRFEQQLSEGKKIYDLLESKLRIQPVGIVPLHTDAGYLFLANGTQKETTVFEYQITIFDQPDERYRAISLQYVAAYEKTLRNAYENIKQDLLRYNSHLPNPATYVIESGLTLPLEDTLLPMAKRYLVKYLSV